MPTTVQPFQHSRYQPAIWYAWGQQDAGIGTGVDVFAFATAHATHAIRVDEGRETYLPAIQEAWRNYVKAHQPVPVECPTCGALYGEMDHAAEPCLPVTS